MSKKQKRRTSSTSTATVNAPQASRPSVAATPNTAVRRTAFTAPEFNPDYSNVISDLKRIGILAGSFIGILVVLSFFLR